MSAIVFVGPTLPVEIAQKQLDAVYLPPAAQGDVYRAAQRSPSIIGVIDGYFANVPAVWHKEILWALSRGIRVFGSASIGALRAAELALFGMEGIGAIYQAYAAGALEDDDEVAVMHGPGEVGYAALSEAMVNIRATLANAEAHGAISAAVRRQLVGIAKQTFFPQRTYENIVGKMDDGGPAWRQELIARLLQHRIDQKQADAIAMLREIRARLEAGLPPAQVDFQLQRSLTFERLVATIEESSDPDPAPGR
ncbi:MAG: hypothetical protein K0S06_2055 [Microvirga sp.]|nr:hypothetical protein [Microvirga sp.]